MLNWFILRGKGYNRVKVALRYQEKELQNSIVGKQCATKRCHNIVLHLTQLYKTCKSYNQLFLWNSLY